jgi:hypothetical protein
MQYLVALFFIGIVAAIILILWMSTYSASMRSVERDRAQARWKPVDHLPTDLLPMGSWWLALTGPSGMEFDHKKVGSYPKDALQRQLLLQQEAESSAEFLNKRLNNNAAPDRHGWRKPRTKGES